VIQEGRQLKAARALLGWSQEDLAAAAGVHRNLVTYYESQGRFTGLTLGIRSLCEALEEADVIFIWEPGPGVAFVDRSALRVRPRMRHWRLSRSLPAGCQLLPVCLPIADKSHHPRATSTSSWKSAARSMRRPILLAGC
jgi:transcriptional regulator with XRE-family HTH domain